MQMYLYFLPFYCVVIFKTVKRPMDFGLFYYYSLPYCLLKVHL